MGSEMCIRDSRYTVRENPEAEERDDVDEFILDEDEPFNLQHRNYELGSRNAGPLFTNNDQTVRPAQVSTKVDYGVYLQFWVRRGASEVPLCATSACACRLVYIVSLAKMSCCTSWNLSSICVASA